MTDLQGLRAARLLRVSTTGQDEDNQEQPTREFIVAKGMITGLVYKLHGVSARKGHQVKAIRDLLEDYERGLFDVLVIRNISRLDRRGPMRGWALIGELTDAGVRVVSVADPELEKAIGGDTTSEMMVSLKLSMARAEVDDKRDKIHDANRRIDGDNPEKVVYFRGAIPAGYRTEGPELHRVLLPDYAGTGPRGLKWDDVRQAILDCGTGTSTTRLANRLDMTPDGVGRLIRNQLYSTGLSIRTRYDGRKVAHRTLPMVKPDEQARAIAALEARRTGDNVSSRRVTSDDYSTALYCWECLHPKGRMQRYTGGFKVRTDGTYSPKVRRYRCQNPACGKSVNADFADAAVNDLMSRQGWRPWYELEIIPGNDHAADLERARIELDALSGRGLDDEAEDAERKRLRAERDRLKGLPIVPPSTRTVSPPRTTWAGHWAELDAEGRRDWLLSGEFLIAVKADGSRTGAVEVCIILDPYGDDDEDDETGVS